MVKEGYTSEFDVQGIDKQGCSGRKLLETSISYVPHVELSRVGGDDASADPQSRAVKVTEQACVHAASPTTFLLCVLETAVAAGPAFLLFDT